MEPPSTIKTQLQAVQYKRTIAVLLVLESSPKGMPVGGGIQLLDDTDLAFITDNNEKGVSPIPSLTIHLSNEASLDLWDEPDETVIGLANDKLSRWVEAADVTTASITRWRYAGPVDVIPESSVTWGHKPHWSSPAKRSTAPKLKVRLTRVSPRRIKSRSLYVEYR